MSVSVDSNRQVVTVSELTRQVRGLLEGAFPTLYVEGEISNFTRAQSGHWYFTLTDDKAQLRCAMFRGRNQAIKFNPNSGMQVVVRGKLGLYDARGEFQMIADFMEEAGDGALRRAYEKLKAELQAQGLFDQERKQALPSLANHVAIITSPVGAAIHDVLTVMGRRFPGMRATLLPSQVQGDEAVPQLVKALALANDYQDDPFDLILLTRGGGSLEDLWAFNTEPVARAVAGSRLPVVCAVGHESDVSIADLVADLRAATPSAAAELITPNAEAWLGDFKAYEASLVAGMQRALSDRGRELTHLRKRLRDPERYLQELQQRADDLSRRLVGLAQRQLEGYRFPEWQRRLEAAVRRQLDKQRSRLAALRLLSPQAQFDAYDAQARALRDKLTAAQGALLAAAGKRLDLAVGKLNTLSPLATLERGFAIVEDRDGHVLTQAAAVKPGDEISARLQAGRVKATVSSVESS